MEVGAVEDRVEATAALLADGDGLDDADEEAIAPASMTNREISYRSDRRPEIAQVTLLVSSLYT
jgi:hypothetical protein